MMNTNPNFLQALFPLLKAILSIPSYFWGWMWTKFKSRFNKYRLRDNIKDNKHRHSIIYYSVNLLLCLYVEGKKQFPWSFCENVKKCKTQIKTM